MTLKRRYWAPVVLGMTLPSAALAHHSFAMFDNNREVVVEGTVREFQWTNPHCWVQLVVKEGVKSVDYSVEGPSPNSLQRVGWNRALMKPGDKVKIAIHPLKDGSKGGSMIRVTLASGRVLSDQPGP